MTKRLDEQIAKHETALVPLLKKREQEHNEQRAALAMLLEESVKAGDKAGDATWRQKLTELAATHLNGKNLKLALAALERLKSPDAAPPPADAAPPPAKAKPAKSPANSKTKTKQASPTVSQDQAPPTVPQDTALTGVAAEKSNSYDNTTI